jgi:hypothetical protein
MLGSSFSLRSQHSKITTSIGNNSILDMLVLGSSLSIRQTSNCRIRG